MMHKTEKSSLFAAVLNFLFWGIGYIYLEKRTEDAFYLIVSYFAICIFSLWYLSVAGVLRFAGTLWIIFWSLWVSMFLSYDSYKIAKVRK